MIRNTQGSNSVTVFRTTILNANATHAGAGDMETDPKTKPNAKRKAINDDGGNPLLMAAKKTKKDSQNTNKRKLNGAEEAGGLRIVRVPASSQETQPNPLNSSQSQLQPPNITSKPPSKKFRASPSPFFQSQTLAASSSKPPSITTKSLKKDDLSHTLAPNREEPDVDEEVRQMEFEAEGLRSATKAHSSKYFDSYEQSSSLLRGQGLNPAFNFPGPRSSFSSKKPPSKSNSKSNSKTNGKSKKHDSLQAIAEHDTPQIERNKLMREGKLPSDEANKPNTKMKGRKDEKEGKGHQRRKSSISNRGKRISNLFEGGVISQPHKSVPDTSFYKHIDCDLPEPMRAQQLLIWCSSRVLASSTAASSMAPSEPKSGPSKDTAASESTSKLSPAQQAILHGAAEDVIRLLADRKIDTSCYGPPSGSGSSSMDVDSSTDSNILAGLDGNGNKLKENEQNVRNRARELTFGKAIEKAKAEENAWLEVANFYNSYRANVLAEIEKLKPPPTHNSLSSSVSSKAKGKQRATPAEVEEWSSPREYDLEEVHKLGVGLAREVLAGSPFPSLDADGEEAPARAKSPLTLRLEKVEFKLDSLHSFLHSALQTTNAASDDLDTRFAAISATLSSRSQSLPPNSRSGRSFARSGSLPPNRTRSRARHRYQDEDPQDLFRALSRIDAERPPALVGDAARRAIREVQRVQDSDLGAINERRLTTTGGAGVGATPRKGAMTPGTPRRVATPGRDR